MVLPFQEQDGLPPIDFIHALTRYWKWIAVIVVLFLGMGAAYAKAYPPLLKYRAILTIGTTGGQDPQFIERPEDVSVKLEKEYIPRVFAEYSAVHRIPISRLGTFKVSRENNLILLTGTGGDEGVLISLLDQAVAPLLKSHQERITALKEGFKKSISINQEKLTEAKAFEQKLSSRFSVLDSGREALNKRIRELNALILEEKKLGDSSVSQPAAFDQDAVPAEKKLLIQNTAAQNIILLSHLEEQLLGAERDRQMLQDSQYAIRQTQNQIQNDIVGLNAQINASTETHFINRPRKVGVSRSLSQMMLYFGVLGVIAGFVLVGLFELARKR